MQRRYWWPPESDAPFHELALGDLASNQAVEPGRPGVRTSVTNDVQRDRPAVAPPHGGA
jgi:hypothetical protein